MNTFTQSEVEAIVSDAVAHALAQFKSSLQPETVTRPTCAGTTQAGKPCRCKILVDGQFCKAHAPREATPEPAPMPSLGTYGDVLRLKVGMSVDVRPVMTGDNQVDKKGTNRLKWSQYRLRTRERIESHVVMLEDKSGHTYREDRRDPRLWTVTRIA